MGPLLMMMMHGDDLPDLINHFSSDDNNKPGTRTGDESCCVAWVFSNNEHSMIYNLPRYSGFNILRCFKRVDDGNQLLEAA